MKTKTLILFTAIYSVMVMIGVVFSLFFGSKNIIIVVMAMVLSITLIKHDLKENLITNFLKIASINLFVGICSFLVCQLPTLSFLVAFIAIFLICILTKNVNSRLSYIFSLEFAYLISGNVGYSGLNMRLLSLVGASILVIILNILVRRLMNKKGSKKDQKTSSNPTNNEIKVESTTNKSTDSNTNLTLKEKIYSTIKKDKQQYLFAIELGIIVAISEFISIYFNIITAKWLSFTAIAILRPNTNLMVKGFRKIKGTLMGVIVFTLIDILILSQGTISVFGLNILSKTISLILILIFSYIYTMTFLIKDTYVIRMAFSTLLSLSIAYISIPQTNFIIDRPFFIIIGTMICILINYSMKQSIEV